MRIENLSIKGFRNLKFLELELDETVPVHAFVGANGQGKTNILEAIYLCSLSKSFRTRTSADLVGFDEDFARVRMLAGSETLEVVITSRPVQKVLKVNGVKKSATDFIGHLKCVFFSPDDLAYMAFAPKLRRRYLDVVLSQLSREYLTQLMAYTDACRQRNSLLKAIAEGRGAVDELDFWDQKLAQLGAFLTEERSALINRLQERVLVHYRKISESEAELDIAYRSEVRGVKPNELKEMYVASHRQDLQTCQTRLGPHRDDLNFLLDGRDMLDFASRGEWRSLVLALKFAEIDLITERTGEKPVLLLDDVFSELDTKRQKCLLEATGQSQTFLTTTHEDFIRELPGDTRLYQVRAGEIDA